MNNRTRAILICWLLMLTIISFDLVTTIVAVEMLGATEQNSFAARLFDIGLLGYLISLLFYAFLFLYTLIIIGGIYRGLYFRITHKEMSISKEIVVYCLVASSYLLLDIVTITGNLIVIWSLL